MALWPLIRCLETTHVLLSPIALAAEVDVSERSPRCNTEGHEVGQWNFPSEIEGEVPFEEIWTLVDENENAADDDRDQDRSPQHAPIAKGTNGALEGDGTVRAGHPKEAHCRVFLTCEMRTSRIRRRAHARCYPERRRRLAVSALGFGDRLGRPRLI